MLIWLRKFMKNLSRMNYRVIISCLAAALLMAGCKEGSSLIEFDPGDEALIYPAAQQQAPVLPVSLDGRFSWKAGDCLRVSGEESGIWRILPGFSSSFGRFSGEAVPGTSFSIYYSEAGVDVPAEQHVFNVQNRSANKEIPVSYFTVSGLSSLTDTVSLSRLAGGAEFHGNGLIVMDLIFPRQVVYLNSLTLKASRAVFYASDDAQEPGDSLRLEFPGIDVGLFKQKFRAVFQTSCHAIELSEGDTFELTARSGETTVRAVVSPTPGSYDSGFRMEIDTANAEWEVNGGEDTEFVISDIGQMLQVREKLAEGVTRFRMAADIDLSSEEWTPIVTDGDMQFDFDGAGHKITGLKLKSGVKYPSFFGRFSGIVKDLVFENPEIVSDLEAVNPTAVVAAYVSSLDAGEVLIKNVEVKGASLTVSASQASPSGMIAGQASGARIENCFVSGTVSHSGAAAEVNVGSLAGRIDGGCIVSNCSGTASVVLNAGRVAGGFIGSIRGESEVSGCSYIGSVTSSATITYAGGFIGHLAGKAKIIRCTSESSVSKGAGNVGGFIASVFSGASGSTISGCTAKVEMSSITGDVCGGFIGTLRASDVLIDSCHVSGNIARADQKSYTGGLVGSMGTEADGVRIVRCSYTGTMNSSGYRTAQTNGGSLSGGLIGYANALSSKTSGVLVENCFTSGKIYDFNHRIGGIIGVPQDGYVIRNCFSTMEIECGHGLGGIVGAEDQGANAKTTSDVYVEGCIAWNPSLVTLRAGNTGAINPASNLGCGAVVGRAMANNVHSSGVRRPDMVFTCMTGDYNTLYDQEDSDELSSLKWNYTATYYAPYHGKAAEEGETLSEVAERLGFSSSVWDFSADTPVFK